jgi:hypothetical protein
MLSRRPFGALIAPIPAPCREHRQHEDPAIAQQVVIDTEIVLAGFLGRVNDVELDGPTAALVPRWH